MSTFDERERGFEKAFAHDEEKKFKIHARCAKLLSTWVAEKIGLSGAELEEYVRRAIEFDMKKSGIDDLIEYLYQDLQKSGQSVSLGEIQSKAQELINQIQSSL